MMRRLRIYMGKIYSLIHPFKKLFWTYAIISIIMFPVMQIGATHFIRQLFDGVAVGDVEKVYFWSISWGIFIIIIMIIMFGHWYIKDKYDILSINYLRKMLLNHILLTERSSLDNYHSGDFISRLNNDVPAALNLLSHIGVSLIINIITFTVMVLYISFISPVLVVTTLFSLPISMVISKYIGPKIKQLQKKKKERWSIINIRLQDLLKGIQVVKGYGLNKILHEEHINNRQYIIQKDIKNVWLNFFLEMGTGGSTALAQVITLFAAGILYINNALALGSVMIVIFGIQFLINPLKEIPQLLAKMEGYIASIDRIFEIFDMKKEDILLGDEGSENPEGIQFKGVNFSYNEGESVLKDISFQINPGEKHAFVGATGSGKTTIAKLLLHFYHPDSGDILISSKNINTKAIREHISYVPQEPYLFTGTIKENISYGKKDVSFEEIVKAAKSADIHDFISKQPKGYDTQIGEEGIKVSGGQRQRIAIARAVLRDAPIFLWDEATSSLDTLSESRVQKMVDGFEKKTVIIIAHRLSTVRKADCIHVLEDGKIIESGSHKQLIASRGRYHKLYNGVLEA